MTRPDVVVVMGVSGSGKTTLARALAAAMDVALIEGDELHPPENIAKMSAGIPLEDADRMPWLETIASRARAAVSATGGPVVVACSALKRSYRDVLRTAGAQVRFVHVHGDPGLIRERMQARAGHFMPPLLLDSQLAALEPLGPDEAGTTVDLGLPVDRLVTQALEVLHLPAPGTSPPGP